MSTSGIADPNQAQKPANLPDRYQVTFYYSDNETMLIALYRVNKAGQMEYYYIHDYQGNLFAPYTFTAIWGRNLNKGREKSFTFTTRQEMDTKLRELFTSRVNTGYKMLYAYPPKNNFQDIFEIADKKQIS